jgi:hypothetical protein
MEGSRCGLKCAVPALVHAPRLTNNLALTLWIIYGFTVGIVLLSLLISIMNDTFDRIKDAEELEVRHRGCGTCGHAQARRAAIN